MNFIEGEVIVFDKPYRWTSFDLVGKARSMMRKSIDGVIKLKVGHAGTLDPLATGVMILCTGKQTKNIEKFQATEKEYIATLKFGATTPCFDLERDVDMEYPYLHITKELLEDNMKKFVGEISQIPPSFSAKWINGQRAYKEAHVGNSLEIQPVNVMVYEMELLEFELPVAKIRITCSKGTYIRALARDIGVALQSGAHLIGLQRTRVGKFLLKDALSLDEFQKLLTTAL